MFYTVSMNNKIIIGAFLLFAFIVLIGSLQTVSHTAATPVVTKTTTLQQTTTVPSPVVSVAPTLVPTATPLPTQAFIPLNRPGVIGGGDD